MKETIFNLKRVYKSYGKEFKSSLVRNIILAILGVVVGIVAPLLSAKFIVDFTTSAFKQAIIMALVIMLVNLFDMVRILFMRKGNQVFRRGIIRNLQMSLGREILKLDQKSLDKNSSGVFIQRLTSDTDKMSGIFTNGVIILLRFLSVIGAFVAILIIDYHMFIYYLIASIILTYFNYVKNQKVGKKDREYRKENDKVVGLTSELVRGARDIKMLFAQKSFMKELDEQIVSQNERIFEMRNIDMNYNILIGYVKTFLEFITVILLILLINNNVLTVAVSIAIYNYRDDVLTNFMDIVSELLEECKNFNISCNRVFEIINSEIYTKEKFGKKHLDKINGNFEFKDVVFGYDDNRNVLDKISFKVKESETVGFVGKSGGGKTTIFNLLCKMYDVKSGSITIDGVNINELDEESIRGNITIISQNPYIFNLSIKDNLRLVKENITDKEIKEACKLACLDDYIESLPQKYDTVVGEGGVTLSGGQRQRLAIARAFVQKTKIILFDEATSALDNETQNKIQQAINNMKSDYTILIIAHRLSTVMNSDRILLLDDGKIKAEGSHKQLLKKSKEYKKLYETELKTEE